MVSCAQAALNAAAALNIRVDIIETGQDGQLELPDEAVLRTDRVFVLQTFDEHTPAFDVLKRQKMRFVGTFYVVFFPRTICPTFTGSYNPHPCSL